MVLQARQDEVRIIQALLLVDLTHVLVDQLTTFIHVVLEVVHFVLRFVYTFISYILVPTQLLVVTLIQLDLVVRIIS